PRLDSGVETPFSQYRVDVDSAKPALRAEQRLTIGDEHGSVVLYDGEHSVGVTLQGITPDTALTTQAHRRTLYAMAVPLLQRLAAPECRLRSEGTETVGGRTERVITLADPVVGLSRVRFDAETGRLVGS